METIKLFTPKQIKELELIAIKKQGLTQDILMENAAHVIFRLLLERFKGYSIIIACGPGNNGKDGLVLARILDSEGWDVTIINLFDTTQDIPSKHIKRESFNKLILDNKTIIIDALFGIGINRKLDNKTQEIISKINMSGSKIISIDTPSGVDALDGRIWGTEAIKADITVTFIGLKIGQILFPGAENWGEVIMSPISIAKKHIDNFKTPLLNRPKKIKPRDRNSHKCSNGKNLTISGSEGYYGAPYFSAKASLLAGSGYSRLITPKSIANVCATLAPEIIYSKDDELKNLITDSTSTIFGPGVGINNRSKSLLKSVIDEDPINLIIDADGLNLVSDDVEVLNRLTNIFVITPHPGEMARLLKRSIKDIEKNRIKYSLEFSKKYNCIVVLKGVFTVISNPSGDVFINNSSSVTLATAGSGDILCGIISGLTAYTDLIDSVKTAVYIHGLAGKLCEKKIGSFGVTALDILKRIPEALNLFNKREMN